MRYRLRTLLILLAVGPMFLAATYWGVKEWQRRQAEAAAKQFPPNLDMIVNVQWDSEEVVVPDESQPPAPSPAPP